MFTAWHPAEVKSSRYYAGLLAPFILLALAEAKPDSFL